ncbi:MAG TPA: hypothetical protein VFK54_05095 [Candidatus Limnocylindrales bacterium]|nr:hypothetical protein [Candidatus Limnocylindrales bacterium]
MRALLAVSLGFAAVIVAACGTPLLPTDEIVVATPAPTSPPVTPSPALPSGSVAALLYDATLLELLPAELDGLPVESAPEAAADIQTDADLVAAGERLALGLVVDPAGELAVAAVIALRPGVFSDAFWRDWRDSYDAGACAQAGGVRGNAEATIGGRLVHIGTCEGGARTYHAHLEDRNILVSVTAIGDVRRLGERLVSELGS